MFFLALITLWLYVFNSGDSQVIEYGFEITESEICYIKYGVRHSIMKSNFISMSIQNSCPKLIRLKAIKGSNIEFSYYTFSLEQRNEIFNSLSNK
jgi:hypothetical protein